MTNGLTGNLVGARHDGPRRGRWRYKLEDIARACGASVWVVKKAVTKGELVPGDLGSVVEWGMRRKETKVVEFEKAKERIG